MTAYARIAGFLAVLSFSSPAFAQPGPEPGPIQLGQQGLAQFETGNWQASYDLFKKANGLSHSPVFELYMARSQKNLGKLLEARVTYDRIASELLPADSPTPWTQAQLDAKAELAALKTKIPAFTLTVKGTKPGETIRASVDSVPVELDKSIEADPGEHLFAAAVGNRTIQKPVRLAEGVRDVVVTLDFQVEKPVDPTPPTPDEGSLIPGAVLLGIGGASLIGGAITGGLALAAAGEIDTLCGGDQAQCTGDPIDVADKESEATTLGHASTGLFIAGGVIAATGIVLMIVRPGGGGAEPPPKAGAMIAPTLGGFVVSGWF